MKGGYRKFLKALGYSESSGRYNIVNKYGYLGKYQMGESALIDAGYYKGDSTKGKNDWVGEWTGKDGVYTKEDFLNNPSAQENAIREYHKKAWIYIENQGLDKYVGQEVNGIKITESGMLAAYHLLGLGNKKNPGLMDFLTSSGKIVGTDKNGTPITEYLKKFAGYDISEIINSYNSDNNNPFTNSHTHTVQPGDTLSKIAKRYNVSLDDLLRANSWIKNPDYIQVGWKIRIPGYAEKVRNSLREGTRRIDPLVIDLDGDGIELVDIKESTAMFDITGSGFANRVGWVYNFA